MAGSSNDNNLALYCDFENIALGVRDAKYQKFDISHILEKLLVKGSIVVKKAYCDWARYKDFKAPMHEASFELIDIPHVRQSGKNSADIRMVVDALDLCYTKAHVDTFVIISGDSDFSPLVSKLRENAKTVIGVGVKNSTSDLLINNCDEFIYYDDLVRELEKKLPARKRVKKRAARSNKSKEDVVVQSDDPVEADKVDEPVLQSEAPVKATKKSSSRRGRGKKAAASKADAGADVGADVANDAGVTDETSAAEEAAAADDNGAADEQGEERIQEGLDLIIETAMALSAERDGNDKLWGSMVKQTLKRRRPGFNESYYGFDSFGKMLEEAQTRGYLSLELDDRSGGYIIRKVGG